MKREYLSKSSKLSGKRGGDGSGAEGSGVGAMSKSDESLIREIKVIMTDETQAMDMARLESVISKIRALDTHRLCDRVRLAACHFMTMYHTKQAMLLDKSPDGSGSADPGGGGEMMDPSGGMGGGGQLDMEAVERFKEAQRQDMLLGWELLQIRSKGLTQAGKTARILKIEVAQRLEDAPKLRLAFDDLMKYPLSPKETLVAFTAAPFLGDWKAMKNLGEKIERMPGGMEQFHLMSFKKSIPDFSQVYELAAEHNLFSDSSSPSSSSSTSALSSSATDTTTTTTLTDDSTQPASDSSATIKTGSSDSSTSLSADRSSSADCTSELKWELYHVKAIRVRFKDVDCGEWVENRDELLAEIKEQGEIDWEDVPNCSHVHVKRMGGLCQAVSFNEAPMMLYGPWFTGKIHVKGKAEMSLMPEDVDPSMTEGMDTMPSPDEVKTLIQEEEWRLDQDEDDINVYRGVYYLKQRPELPPSHTPTKDDAPVNMTFDCEITFLFEPSEEGASDGGVKKDEDEGADDKKDDDDDDVVAELVVIDEVLPTEIDGLKLD